MKAEKSCLSVLFCGVFSESSSAKLHYTDSGYGHAPTDKLTTSCRCCTTRPSRLNLLYNILPATDMLYNTTNGRAHNNSTTCCTTDSPPTDRNVPRSNILTSMLGSGIAMWQICSTTSCRIVVSLSVGGVVQHVRTRCPCSGVWH